MSKKYKVANFRLKLKKYLFEPRFHFSRFQFNLMAVFLIGFGIVFGGFLTVKNILFPKIFALNDTTKTWTFSVGVGSSFTYDTNLISIGSSGASPISNVNKLINPSFSSDTSSWTLTPINGDTTPTGWVVVTGDGTYVSANTAWLTMKYEAKCASTSNLGVGLTAPADTTYKVYRDDGTGTPANNCTSANNRAVTSLASGYPVTYLYLSEANTRCNSINIGSTQAHLITNAEWMAVARDAEAQATNWSLGVGGSGYLYAGHNDNQPAWALQASTNDANKAAFTDATGVTEAQTSATNTANGTSGTTGNQVRTLTLSNGSVVWDLAGNVYEWTNNTINGSDKPVGVGSTSAWSGWDTISSWGTLSSALTRPANSNYYTSGYGVGQYYEGLATGGPYGFLRGGHRANASSAGAFSLALDSSPGLRYYSIGFRCSSDPVAISQSFSSSSGRIGGGDAVIVGSPTNALFDGKLVQSANVGSTASFDFSAYVYDSTTGNVGGVVTSSIAQLYYNGVGIGSTYSNAGSGWWKLSTVITGANASRDFGLLVKAGKTVNVDDFTLSRSGTYSIYTTSAYTNTSLSSWDSFSAVGTGLTGNANVYYQICLDDGSACGYSSGSRWQYYTGGSWANSTDATIAYANTASQLTTAAMQALPITSQKISVKAIFTFGGADVPYISSFSVGLTTDTTPPGNISAISMKRNVGVGSTVVQNSWTNDLNPYFSWDQASDNVGGVGIKGYCLFITSGDTEPNLQTSLSSYLPENTNLDATHITSASTQCGNGSGFLVSTLNIDFATSTYRGNTWLSSSSTPYYLWVKAVDSAGLITASDPVSFYFRFDNTAPTNVTYISPASGSFSNVADMSFSWPTSTGVGSTDANAGILGWQYQINATSGTWLGTTTNVGLGVSYMPTSVSTRTLTQAQDGGAIVSGNNVVYFRTVDNAGNFSSDATIRTGNLSYGGAAPAFGGTDVVTITPSTSTTNSFALSWPAATATFGQTVAGYYYMINTSPPSTYATLIGNASTYIGVGTSISIPTAALTNVNKGSNTVYVVAIDNATTPNYSPTNYISGTFTLNSTTPDNVGNLVASDSSIKSQSQWNVTLTWTVPSYQGAGNLTYLVYRSANGTTFSSVGTTSGLSYVDNTPSSAKYYYKIYTQDGADATSSGTNAVSITPTGKWTSAPSLSTGPDVGSITTKKATITWTTSRSSDSKIQYGTGTNSYGTVEPSNSSQVSSHSIQLTGLSPGTTYYYRAKWTDEDGNTGTSDEKTFSTSAAPTVKDVSVKSIGLTSAIVQYTSKDASKVKIYYGKTTSFGGAKETATSTTETIYTSELSSLDDGTKYYYKINTFDSDGSEYEGTVLDFTTLPRPKISNVRLQQVANTAQSTILVTWNTNTEVSSIVTNYPIGSPSDARDDVSVALTKGEHRMIVRGLLPQTDYILVVKGRDKIGNEATSDLQRFTTATDTRPPQISELHVEGTAIPPTTTTAQESTAQLIVSWNTDEPATSQVEFGEGTGATYSQKTQEDTNLTFNHLVIISNLTPSKVYHLRSLSKDKAGNVGNSIDTVTIAPKATENALNLVISNLQEAFGFLGGIKR